MPKIITQPDQENDIKDTTRPNKFFNCTKEFINLHTIKSNRVYGTAISNRNAIEIIDLQDDRIQAWVGGLDGKMIEGGGGRRQVEFLISDTGLIWNCTGNPKNHQIFCKHCVALALFIKKI
jgi:hypothetical protein